MIPSVPRQLAGSSDEFDRESLPGWTLTSLGAAILDRRISAEEAVSAYLDRIEKYDSSLHCFTEVFADRSLETARAIDRRIAAGESVGPLAGCPIAVKDNLCTDWGHTTCSSEMLRNYESPFDATVVRRLRQADVIIIGKTRMDEFAMGSSCERGVGEPTRNPWDHSRVPGGSSGGSAAAVAASLCTAALGSDTGGSVRQPASFCGVVGFKPTYGSVSRYGLAAFASSLDQIGPITKTVEDAATLHHRIRGYDPNDSTTNPESNWFEPIDINIPITEMRVGVPRQFMSEANDPSVTLVYENAIETLRASGASIVEIDLPMMEYAIATYYVICTAEASSNLARYDGIRYGRRAKLQPGETFEDLYAKSRGEGFGSEVKRRIVLGAFVLSAGYHDQYYNRALKVRRLIKEDFDRTFAKCDAILGPTSPTAAFRLGEKTSDPLEMYLCDLYTVGANLAGIPAISVPAGFAEVDGGHHLPIGLQFTGSVLSDLKLLRIARTFQQHAAIEGRPSDFL